MAFLVTAGHGGRLGTAMPGAEAIHSIELDGVDPQRHSTGLLTRFVGGWPNGRIDELHAVVLDHRRRSLSVRPR